jgi:hypothetical protein
MINDWTGDKFLYERPYGAIDLQIDAQNTKQGKPPKKDEYKVILPKVKKNKNWKSIEQEAEEKEE